MSFKKILSVVMLCVMLSSFLSVSSFATSDKQLDFEDALSYTCVYDNETSNIVIEGTVNHDAMIKYKDYEIRVYAIAPGSDYDTFISESERQPLISTTMTIRFSFTINVMSSVDRFSRYVVALRSPNGDEYPATKPMIPSVASDFHYTYEERENFKGIHSDNISDITASGAGTVIVDVNIGDIVGDTSDSILYFMNGKYFYMRRSYISEIDTKVRSASVSGSKVYLRYLLDANRGDIAISQGEEIHERYSIPNLYKEDTLDLISAVSGFFAERYNGEKGSLFGIILGDRIDDVETVNHIGDFCLKQYADMYALYLAVVANTVRITHPHIDIVIPLSGINDYSSDAAALKRIRPSIFLEEVISINDANFANEFKCSVMISSNTVPFELSNESLKNGIDMSHSGSVGLLSPDNIAAFISFVDTLSKKYSTTPDNILYFWDVPQTLDGSALCCAYIYSYYRLYAYGKVSSFVASFNGEYDNYRDVSSVFKYIDNDDSNQFIEQFASYFGKDSWKNVLDMLITVKSTNRLFEVPMSGDKDDNITGEFSYIDFSDASAYSTMLAGDNCEYLQIALAPSGTRALLARSSTLSVGEKFECFSVFDYPESYVYTSNISLILGVDSELGGTKASYEVTVTLGDGKDRIEAIGIVKRGERMELIFDASQFSAEYLADYAKISVRCLTGDTGRISLWLYELKGYSDKYLSEGLEELIEEQRIRIRTGDTEVVDNSENTPKTVLTVIGVLFALVAVTVSLFIIFRKDETINKTNDS